jgi:alpha-maltose-1-phosphate synthase
MKALFLTNEYPPNIYGGAGVHVDYLSRELAKIMDVEVRCFGDQEVDMPHLGSSLFSVGNLVRRAQPT